MELTVVEGDLRELVRERVSRLKSDKERLSAQVSDKSSDYFLVVISVLFLLF